MVNTCYKKKETGSFLGYPTSYNRGHEAPLLQTHFPGKLSHESDYASARFGLVGARLSPLGFTLASLLQHKRDFKKVLSSEF